MKVYLTPPQPSRGLQRIADALVKYKPEWVEVVSTQAEAELVVVYAIGRCNQVSSLADYLLSTGRKYAVIQVCLRSTQKPNAFDWFPIWEDAAVVWSYYDLNRMLNEDDDNPLNGAKWDLAYFYHAPLGVESEVFYPRPKTEWFIGSRGGTQPIEFTIASSGLSRLSESVRECALAVNEIDNGFLLHLGPVFTRAFREVRVEDITDDKLAAFYSACQFVSALRRKEGFELPAAEGLLCGARPIAFDTPDYRWIYKSWAEYIHEGTRQEVVDQLIELFRRGARPVTQDEINEARQWFHWPTIVGGFYERLR